ncbi:MAG: Selenide, water dikinase [Chloroflexi bacterium ADurb.Bin180]|nr:MAG: Selenide, water dikinase [Chloroflexi bacterium ADurb.Bin180]
MNNLFPPADYPDLLVGLAVSDDAAVYRINDDLAIIQTVDFFTPIVDDPYTYGAIAAVNAMSDVYAMGGQVTLALNIACFPANLPPETISAILKGGADKVREAGGVVAGGHTVDDPEPKFGMAVMGTVNPRHVTTKAGARPGDVLLLTKPLGVGIITTAAKRDAADPVHLEAAISSMLQSNRIGAELASRLEIHAMTDITGFALLGHSCEMAEHSGVQLRFDSARLPFLPGVYDYAQRQLFPGGTQRNADYYSPAVRVSAGVSEDLVRLIYTPETSGGLLIALPEAVLQEAQQFLEQRHQPVWIIGQVQEGSGILIQ